MKKLSAYCRSCQRELSLNDMDHYLMLCEKRGRDPLIAKDGSILCCVCVWTAIVEMANDDEDPLAEQEKESA